jgi:hypothetical protein
LAGRFAVREGLMKMIRNDLSPNEGGIRLSNR